MFKLGRKKKAGLMPPHPGLNMDLSADQEKTQATVPARELHGEVPASGYLTYTKMYKALMTIIGGLTFAVVLLVIGYTLILPLKQIEPIFFMVDLKTKEQVYKLLPLNEYEGRLAVAKYFLRNYVVARETVDRMSEFDAVKQVKAMSDPDVFDRFQKLKYDLYKIDGFKRDISIISDTPVAKQGDNYWMHEVVFMTTDTNEAKHPGEVHRAEWTARIAYSMVPQKVQPASDGGLLNPAGIQIREYTVISRAKTEDTDKKEKDMEK